MKLALAATHRRLVRQLVSESLIVSIAGGVLGLLLAGWILTAVPALFSPDDAELLPTGIDPVLVLLTIGIGTLAGAAFGIAPALQASGAPAALALRADPGDVSEEPRSSRVRAALVTAQVALSTLLVIATAFAIDSLRHALQGDFGPGARQIALLSIRNPGGNCSLHDPARGLAFQEALPEKLRRTAGIASAGWAATAPLGRQNLRQYTIAAGARTSDRVDVDVNVVSPEYFDTLGIPLLEGRHSTGGTQRRTSRPPSSTNSWRGHSSVRRPSAMR